MDRFFCLFYLFLILFLQLVSQPSTKQGDFTAAFKDCNKDKNRSSWLIPGEFPELYSTHHGGTVIMERINMNKAVMRLLIFL